MEDFLELGIVDFLLLEYLFFSCFFRLRFRVCLDIRVIKVSSNSRSRVYGDFEYLLGFLEVRIYFF